MNTINGIPIVWDTEGDNNLFGSLFPEAISSGGNLASVENLLTGKSFEEISNERAMSSPFGENSLFSDPGDGSFINTTIDKQNLLKTLIDYTLNKKRIQYNYLDYIGRSENVIIEGVEINVDMEVNVLRGEIDCSKLPRFKFIPNLTKQNVNYKILYEFVKYKNSDDNNRIAIILNFKRALDLDTYLNNIDKELQDFIKNKIKIEFENAFKNAKTNSEVLDFLYEVAPDYVLLNRSIENLYYDLILLSSHGIDSIGTNENISVINIINTFERKKSLDKQWFYNQVNADPTTIRIIFEKIGRKYVEKLIVLLSKIGYSIWSKKQLNEAWDFNLDYSEFKINDNEDVEIYEPFVLHTGFAYYNKALKMFKIGTTIFTYEDKLSLVPFDSREIGPDELQFPYIPMKLIVANKIIFIPVFVAEYFTSLKIDEEWWTILNNLVVGILPESSASTRAMSTIAKLFGGKKIQTVEELIEFLNKIDDSVKATELEEYGIEVLFRGTTRNAKGELYSGNINSIENGTSTSTDPIRAIIFGIESATTYRQKGFLQIFVPKNLEGLNLQTPNRMVEYELEIIIKTSPENLSNLALIEIPIEDARKLIEEVYGISLDTRISNAGAATELLKETKKLAPKQALEFYKKVIKLKK